MNKETQNLNGKNLHAEVWAGSLDNIGKEGNKRKRILLK